MCARWAPSKASYRLFRPQASLVQTRPVTLARNRSLRGPPSREKGEPSAFWRSVVSVGRRRAELVADVMVWAARQPQAANGAFNLTNGDRVRVATVAGQRRNPRVQTGPESQRAWKHTRCKRGCLNRSSQSTIFGAETCGAVAKAPTAGLRRSLMAPREGPSGLRSTVQLRRPGAPRPLIRGLVP